MYVWWFTKHGPFSMAMFDHQRLWPRFSPDSVHEPMAQGVGQIARAHLLHLGIEIGQLGGAKQRVPGFGFLVT